MNVLDSNHWEELTDEQQQGIIDAIKEINNGRGITHEKVMDAIRKKYTDA
jgi:predicted transcriptional regulator